MKKELVRDWMTTDVITITPDMTLPEAHQLMTNEEIRRLPVVDKAGHLVGIVSIGDLVSAVLAQQGAKLPALDLDHWQDHDPQPLYDHA